MFALETETAADAVVAAVKAEQSVTVIEPEAAALEAILTYSWPGNVRELQNVVEHAVVLGKDVEVQVEDLPARFSNTDPDEVARYQSATLDIAQRAFKRQYVTHVLQQTEGNRSRAAKVLDIQRTYLSRLIKELQIDG